jgi:hypothetical protein
MALALTIARMNATLTGLGSTLARSFVRAVLIALYLTAAVAASPVFAANGEVRKAASPDSQGVLAVCGLMILTVGAAVARWFREEPV